MSSKTKSRIYFSSETEEAIIAYNSSNDESFKRKIYRNSIRTPLRSLTEAVIHKYKYYKTGIEFADLIDDCEGFLVIQFSKLRPDKGKAFSYLTVILRNYLTAQSKKTSRVHSIPIEIDNDWFVDDNMHYQYREAFLPRNASEIGEENEEIDLFINKLMNAIQILIEFPQESITEKDKIVFDALISTVKYHKVIGIFNKKYLLFILREITGLKTKSISQSLKKLEGFYADFKKKYLRI